MTGVVLDVADTVPIRHAGIADLWREGGRGDAAVMPARLANPIRAGLAQILVEGGRPAENLARAEEAIRDARRRGAQLVLLPETLDAGWTHPSAREHACVVPGRRSDAAGPTGTGACRRLAEAAARHSVMVCAGITERDGPDIHNTAVLWDTEGRMLLRHRKLHELDFARETYRTGDSLGVVDTDLGRIGLMICADAFAPGLPFGRALGALGADLILSPCAWAVPPGHDNVATPYGGLWGDSYGPVAREHGLWVAAVSNVGPIRAGTWAGHRCIGNSMVVGPDGGTREVLPHGADAAEVRVVTIGG
jgi:predicted amidohydrolase